MTVKDCILSADRDSLFIEFRNLFEHTDSVSKDIFNEILTDIDSRVPNHIDYTLIMKEFEDKDSISYDTYMIDSDGNDFSLMFVRWNDLIGLTIDFETLQKFDVSLIAANVLYEMTWFGYTEKDMIKYEKETFG